VGGFLAWCLVYTAVGLAFAPVALLKGKRGSFLIGWVIPLAWIVAALRLANPGSWWAKRFYDDRKVLRSEPRAAWGPR
jgi:hypothetical protein